MPKISDNLGAANSSLGLATQGLNGDPNGENQDEYTDFLAIQAIQTRLSALATKYAGR